MIKLMAIMFVAILTGCGTLPTDDHPSGSIDKNRSDTNTHLEDDASTQKKDNIKRTSGYSCFQQGCPSFGQVVSNQHQHGYYCMAQGCSSFGQQVGPTHQHWFHCIQQGCTSFNQYVSPTHQHNYR